MNEATAHLLTADQRRIGERVLAEEEARRRHLVVSLSGAHAYGFPSPDSDLDLKAIHVAKTGELVGLSPPKLTFDRLEIIEGIEIDYTSNELGAALNGVLAGNGNFAERVLGAHALLASPELDSLRPLVQRALSKRLHRHYRGFATSQLEAVNASDTVPAKKVLYVLRTTLTGAHVLRTGELVADLATIASDYGFSDAHALIEQKKAGEKTPLSPTETARWRTELARAFQTLDEALTSAILPDEPPNRDELDAWLRQVRRQSW